MLLRNVTQDIVFQKLDEMRKQNKDICPCEKCRLDIAAIALNNLPPRYVVTDRGEVLTRTSGLDIQISADVIQELSRALQMVKERPQHDESTSSK
jgi:competence protein ComFB